MSEEREVEYFTMNEEDIPTRYMALCIWTSQMTDGDLSVQDVHNMVTDLMEEHDFEGGLASEDLTTSEELH